MLCDSGTALFCVNLWEGCQDSRCLSNWTSLYESLENIRFVIRSTSSPQTKSQDVDYFFKTTLSVTHRQTFSKGGEWWNETHCCKLHANRRNNSQNRWAINVGSCCVRFHVEPLPRVFDMLQYFKAILPLVERLRSSRQYEVYSKGSGAAGGLWRHQQWSPSWSPFWILMRIRNQVKTATNGSVLCFTCKVTHEYALCIISSTSFTFIVERSWKDMHFHSKRLDHLLLMTSYLVTITTDHHYTCLRMRDRDKWTATENVRGWCFIVYGRKKNLKKPQGVEKFIQTFLNKHFI